MSSGHLLPCDLWCYIGLKLDCAGDRIRFRAVSKSWRSLLPFRQPPWLMLAQDEREPGIQHDVEEEESESEPLWMTVLDSSEEFFPPPPPPRGFVCLTDQQISEIDFPELDRARTVGCTGNWLITMHLDRTLRMLNPFSRQQIHLPPPRTFENRDNLEARDGVTPEDYRDALVWKVVLSSPPSCDGGGDWVAIAIHHSHTLAIARPGDASWTTVKESFWVEDAIFYKQQFYAIHKQGRLMVGDIASGLHLPQFSYLTHPIFTSKEKGYHNRKHYLVECLGEILYIVKFVDQYENPDNYKTNRFQVYKFDRVTMKFIEMKSLGEHSLFLGHNTSISVRASDYDELVKKNCIYFTDDYLFGYMGMRIPGGHDMGVFDLEDKSITPHYKDYVRKLALWHTKTFRPIMTHDELDPIMSTLGFHSVPITTSSGGATPSATLLGWKEYRFNGGADRSIELEEEEEEPLPVPRFPYPRIDGLHILTYCAFCDAVGFYIGDVIWLISSTWLILYVKLLYYMGVFDLEDKSITPHYKGMSTSLYSPPT